MDRVQVILTLDMDNIPSNFQEILKHEQEVGDFGDENSLPPLNLLRSTKLYFTTEPPISCWCC